MAVPKSIYGYIPSPGFFSKNLSGITHPGYSFSICNFESFTISYPKLYLKNSCGVSVFRQHNLLSIDEHLLGTDSAGMIFAASFLIFSGSSCPALLKICMTLARSLRIFSNNVSLFSRSSGSGEEVRSLSTKPRATVSSIAWAPPCPWSDLLACSNKMEFHSRGSIG